jgi:hypothetical protein
LEDDALAQSGEYQQALSIYDQSCSQTKAAKAYWSLLQLNKLNSQPRQWLPAMTPSTSNPTTPKPVE